MDTLFEYGFSGLLLTCIFLPPLLPLLALLRSALLWATGPQLQAPWTYRAARVLLPLLAVPLQPRAAWVGLNAAFPGDPAWPGPGVWDKLGAALALILAFAVLRLNQDEVPPLRVPPRLPAGPPLLSRTQTSARRTAQPAAPYALARRVATEGALFVCVGVMFSAGPIFGYTPRPY